MGIGDFAAGIFYFIFIPLGTGAIFGVLIGSLANSLTVGIIVTLGAGIFLSLFPIVKFYKLNNIRKEKQK